MADVKSASRAELLMLKKGYIFDRISEIYQASESVSDYKDFALRTS